jgi:SAM-dependent methyltransferase
MAINFEHHSLPLLRKACGEIHVPGSRWAFLGNQRITGVCRFQSIKPFLELLGAEVVMWDANGKDGAVRHDLREPVGPEYAEWADVVCNFGTSEHVRDNQRQVFKTIHEVCRHGGLMLHSVPASGGCQRHGFWKYTTDWYFKLAEANGYQVLQIDRHPVKHDHPGEHWYVVAMLRKNGDVVSRPFADALFTDPCRER